ncbi:MAG: undecaprenyldiphospho-muramoylpentapeptide beta-N-acetylglucosaminyltransferase [Polyangiaceae bacterium]|nr:undecaprenyldiphospho-muramoylpentapeptide beta-N-acetylglucosaminyltransferase [Polyangiaceae bacterium]
MTRPAIVFAGGGTGGHVFPLLAVADALRRIAPAVQPIFVGTERGIETRVIPERGYELVLVEVAPIRGCGVAGALRGVGKAAASVPAAARLLAKRRPRAVFSVGGYVAGPISLAARLKGIPLALLEPNAAIGLSNQLVASVVSRAYTAFAEPERHFRPSVVLRTGVPIRDGFAPRPYQRGLRQLAVLVLGGSQGARTLNESIPRSLAQARTPVRVVHQCGRIHEAETRALYLELGAGDRAAVVPFIEDMPAAIGAADLVVSRSGASAVSEICAIGRPSLLVPYPFAAADHQRCNAESLAGAGAALMVANDAATPERIATELDRLASEPGRLEAMAEAARRFGQPGAAEAIARDLLALAGLDAEREGSNAGSASAAEASSRPRSP